MDQKAKDTSVSEPASELEGVIKRILDIDRKARSVTAEAQNMRLKAEQDIAGQKAAMREKYRKEAEHRIELVQAEEEKLADQALARTREGQQQKLDGLDRAFQEKGDAWAEEIFRRSIE